MSDSKKLTYFLSLTFLLSYTLEFYVIFNGGVQRFGISILIGLMWLPAISSLIIRTVSGDWQDIGIKIGSIKSHLIAFLFPFTSSFLVFLACSFLGFREIGLLSGSQLSTVIAQLPIILILGILGAFGEEIGWRGFLTPKIYTAGWKFPTTISGTIWAVWHLPIVAFGGYYQGISPSILIVLYFVSILVLNVYMNWIRLFSGSVIVATSAHAFYNFFFQVFWLHLLFKEPGPNEKYWLMVGGDMGIMTSVVLLALILIAMKLLGLKVNDDSVGLNSESSSTRVLKC